MRVFNTLGRRYEEFVPRTEGQVSIYVCGPTVQSEPHVGHGRSAVAFDVIRRYLDWRGFRVLYVRNITDIDDKVIVAAAEAGVPVAELAEANAKRFQEAYLALGALTPDTEPKATEHIPEMIELIARLIDRGLAYPSSGDVYFSVRTLESYGRLSGRNPDELLAGARVEPSELKEDPLDFALWKAAKPGEPAWDSPWGPGRPGWHIECSAMAARYLGDGFDIHGGGTDLIFPHHENEIAQSEGASGKPFARYWLHNGMLNLGGEKMAKSTGLVVDLVSLLDQVDPTALRLLFLRAHYRSQLEYSADLLDDAVASLDRLRRFEERIDITQGAVPDPDAMARFSAAMDDDFSTPEAVGVLFDLVRLGNRRLDDGEDASPQMAAFLEIGGVLGLLAGPGGPRLDDILPGLAALAERLGVPTASDGSATIEALVEARQRARARNDFATADTIRDDLARLGIVLEDGREGTRWVRR
jgi:cysteinyl-tRNA synthetase